MGHQESEIAPVPLPTTATSGWRAVERRLRGSVLEAGRFLAWLTDGMAPEHRTALASLVPRPVTAVLARLLGRGYAREIAPVWR